MKRNITYSSRKFFYITLTFYVCVKNQILITPQLLDAITREKLRTERRGRSDKASSMVLGNKFKSVYFSGKRSRRALRRARARTRRDRGARLDQLFGRAINTALAAEDDRQMKIEPARRPLSLVRPAAVAAAAAQVGEMSRAEEERQRGRERNPFHADLPANRNYQNSSSFSQFPRSARNAGARLLRIIPVSLSFEIIVGQLISIY